MHGNIENCLEWRVATLKVAIACAVIRNKPPGQSVGEFINDLREYSGNKVNRSMSLRNPRKMSFSSRYRD